MKATSTSKFQYYKLDAIGFIGEQKAGTKKQVKLSAIRTAHAIKKLKSSAQIPPVLRSSRNKKLDKVNA